MRCIVLLLSLFFLPFFSEATVSPATPAVNNHITGPVYKLNFSEWVVLRLIQKKYERISISTRATQVRINAKAAFVPGIIGLAGLIIPRVNLFSLSLAIIALIIGYKARKSDPQNTKAWFATITGWNKDWVVSSNCRYHTSCFHITTYHIKHVT